MNSKIISDGVSNFPQADTIDLDFFEKIVGLFCLADSWRSSAMQLFDRQAPT